VDLYVYEFKGVAGDLIFKRMKMKELETRVLALFAVHEPRMKTVVEAVERCGKGEGRISS